MNSTFQCLAACDLAITPTDQLQNLVANAIQHITLKMGPDHLAIVSALKQYLPAFNNTQQQDAFHFLESITSTLTTITGTQMTQTRCGSCKQWSAPNQPQPIVGYTVTCLPNVCTLGEAVQEELRPITVQSGGNGWEWW